MSAPQIALLQPFDRHKGQAVSRSAQSGNNGVAGMLIGFHQPLLHAFAVVRAKAKAVLVADKAGIYAGSSIRQAQQIHIHGACCLHQAQAALALPGQLIHRRHRRAVERVAAQGYHGAIGDGRYRLAQACQLAHLAALAAIWTASHTPENGGA